MLFSVLFPRKKKNKTKQCKAKVGITGALYWTIYRIACTRIFLTFPSCEYRRGMERSLREVQFCLIRLPVQLQSSVTNSFQRFCRSAVLEVFPKHLGYNRFTTCVSAFAGSKLLPISTSISLCKAAKLVLSCLRSSPIPAYKARHELEESLNLYGVKLPLKFHKQDEYIWLKYSGNNRPRHFSYLALVSFFLRSCKVFLVCLVISRAFLVNSILDNNLSCLSTPSKTLWVLFWQFPWLWVTCKHSVNFPVPTP